MKNLLTWIAVLLTVQVTVEMAERGYAWYTLYQAKVRVEAVQRETERERSYKNCLYTQREYGDGTEEEAQALCEKLYGPKGIMR